MQICLLCGNLVASKEASSTSQDWVKLNIAGYFLAAVLVACLTS